MRKEEKLEIRTEKFIFRLEQINNSIFRIRRAVNTNCFKNISFAVCSGIGNENITYETDKDCYLIQTDYLKLKICSETSRINFYDIDNKLILSESSAGVDKSEIDYSIKQNFNFDIEEGLFGLGQYQDGIINHQNKRVIIAQSNRIIAVPFLTSSKGYGILWDNNSWTEFEVFNGKGGFYSEIADCIDYYFIYGSTCDRVIANYRYLTGEAPLYGKWAYGYWQSKERYKNFDELESVIKEYRERKIPIDNIIQDWKYWGELGWNALNFDTEIYLEPEKRIAEFHDKYNCRFMVSIWPTLGIETEPGKEINALGGLFPIKCWSEGYVYDAYNADAQTVYWKHVEKNLFSRGVDAFWIDGSEPEFFTAHSSKEFKKQMYEGGDSVIGSLKKYLNPYIIKAVQPVYEGQRRNTDKKRVFILTRSGFSGQQRYAASSWSGDIVGSWDVFQKQIAAGISFCMSGIPYWTHDIGGFFTNRYKKGCLDLEYRELYLRWFQFGVFTPIFRAHGTNTPREVWRFGDKGDVIYDTLVKFSKLRYRLIPYIYSCAGMITFNAYTLLRGLPMDFQDDCKCYNINNQYMFGPSIMVCPVTERMFNVSDFEDGDIIESEYFINKDDLQNCLSSEYFEGTDFKCLKMQKNDNCIDFDWSGGTPEGVSYHNYSIRWEGFIKSDISGVHEITLVSSIVKLCINGEVIVDELTYSGDEIKSYKFKYSFEKDKKYSIKIEYKRAPENALICLKWKKPGIKALSVPENPKEKEVYLPENCNWYDFWNYKKDSGGNTIKRETPLWIMPLFIKEGSIIPFGPELQFVNEKPADPVELYIYTGKNGDFILYEDEGDNYNYEKGFYSMIKINWFNSEKKLILEDRQGEFEGMLKKRTFIPVIVEDGRKIVQEPVEYCGKKISIEY